MDRTKRGEAPGSDVVERELDGLRGRIGEDMATLADVGSAHAADDPRRWAELARTCAELLADAGMAVEPDRSRTGGPGPVVRAAHRGATGDGSAVLLHARYDAGAAGVAAHLATCRVLGLLGAAPGVRVVLAGDDGDGAAVAAQVERDPGWFRADAVCLAGDGVASGPPALAAALRGELVADLSVGTLDGEAPAGACAGPAPDAYLALTRVLARLHDDEGNVAVPGLGSEVWTGPQPDRDAFRRQVGVKRGARLVGTGSLGSQLRGKPALTVAALAGPPGFDRARDVVWPAAEARLSLRLAPGDDPAHAFECLRAYLERPDVNPWGAVVALAYVCGTPGYPADTDREAHRVAEEALRRAYRVEQVPRAEQGAATPLVDALRRVNPGAALLLWGAGEPAAGDPADADPDGPRAMAHAQALVALGLAGADAPVPAPRATTEELMADAAAR